MGYAFKSKKSYILTSVGAAVGLGNALRFPGLCARYGGAFLMLYLIALVCFGVPILCSEVALGRKFSGGAPKCFKCLYKKAEPLGWASTFNSAFVAIIYSGLLGWIIAMIFKIVPLCINAPALTEPEISAYFFNDLDNGSLVLGVCIAAGWVFMGLILRRGTKSLSKSASFTVIIPIALLTLMACRGLLYENSGKALYALFVPDFSKLKDGGLWLNVLGQVFFSLSIMVGIMPAYGACLPEKTNILTSSAVIASADFFVSVLSSVVMFTTLYGCGLESEIKSSGIEAAFAVYPVAITRLFGGSGIANGVFGVLFYFALALMALQSAVSMFEALIGSVLNKFNLSRKAVLWFSATGCALSFVFATKYATAALDIADHFANYFNVLILGVLECVTLGKSAKQISLTAEINRYTKKLRMSEKFLCTTLKYICPAVLSVLCAWGLVNLVLCERWLYGGYPLWQQIVFGWSISVLCPVLGFITSKNPKKLKVVPRSIKTKKL